MKVFRIKISAWTASFRYPNIISGYQPTLEVPPLSTILGLMNACAGRYLNHADMEIGYYFSYRSISNDLETIYQMEYDKGTAKKQVKSNVINRQFLFDNTLYIYIIDKNFVEYFQTPVFQILLGRSCDLATIEDIVICDLKEVNNASKIKGQIVPFNSNFLPGTIQALPKYFTNTIPRENVGTEAYSVIGCNSDDFSTNLSALRDSINGKDVDIYMHHLRLGKEK